MSNRLYHRLNILFLFVISFSCMNKTSHFEYADGNGNVYIISSSTLTYIPVKPEESSSGTYSGGSTKSLSITAGQFELISTVLLKAIGSTANHISDRVMMSGAISVIDGTHKKQCILSPGSVEQKEIEATLREILSQ